MYAYPLTEQSRSWYGVLYFQPLHVAGVDTLAERQRLRPSLLHGTAGDRRTDVTTKQAQIAPLVTGDNPVTAIVQLRNKKSGASFTQKDDASSAGIPTALGIARLTVRRIAT